MNAFAGAYFWNKLTLLVNDRDSKFIFYHKER